MSEGLLTDSADNPSAGAGEGTQDIFAGVAKEVRFSGDGNDKLARFTDVTSLANSYLEQEKMNSGRVKMPSDTSTPDEISAFYQKLGTPPDASGYSQPELAEGETVDTEFFGAIAAGALKGNVSNEGFGHMVKAYQDYSDAKINAEVNATEAQLQSDWVGDYDKNIETIERLFREHPDKEAGAGFKEWFVNSGGGRDVRAMKGMYELAKSFLDDTLVKGDKVPEKVDDYVPSNRNSPEMYTNGEDEESVRARAYFTAKGHKY